MSVALTSRLSSSTVSVKFSILGSSGTGGVVGGLLLKSYFFSVDQLAVQ